MSKRSIPIWWWRDGEGKVYSVRYEAVNAMLLNEFLKAHRRIEEQDTRIDELTAQLKEQAALIQKVNDKVELNRSAPQSACNHHEVGAIDPNRLGAVR
jgi:hypothetical protein